LAQAGYSLANGEKARTFSGEQVFPYLLLPAFGREITDPSRFLMIS